MGIRILICVRKPDKRGACYTPFRAGRRRAAYPTLPEVEDLVDHTGHYATGSPILRRLVGDGRFVKES